MEGAHERAPGVAHDLNNLLAVILNYAHSVHRELPEDSPLRDDVEQISHAAGRASELAQQLLFSRRDRAAAPQTIDVSALVVEAERLLRATIPEHVTLTISARAGSCFAIADPAQLEQVLLNLVLNARDAMPDGGVIAIETRLDGARVSVAVTDAGTGMEPEVVERAFEPFFTTKPRGAGTGLGLASVHGTIAEAGGEVRIDSTPGKGTTVTISLPSVSEPPSR
jgi:two-component system cell cycle sensor histidine kinase/response regulator CckA